MPSRNWRRPSPALVISLLALFISLGGVTWAATQLPANSVGSSQIRNGSVTGTDVKDGSLTADDFKSKSALRGPTGATGAAGAAGATGAAGAAGAPGHDGTNGTPGTNGTSSLEGLPCSPPGYTGVTKVVKWLAGTPVVACVKTVATAFAGNGVVENTEECDDGNTMNGDGCSSTALIERTTP